MFALEMFPTGFVEARRRLQRDRWGEAMACTRRTATRMPGALERSPVDLREISVLIRASLPYKAQECLIRLISEPRR